MFVLKRNGKKEEVDFNKITKRISNMSSNLKVNPVLLAQKVIQGVYNEVKTTELDNLAAETAAFMSTIHPDYSLLAARIAISNLQKETPNKFSDCIKILYNYTNPNNNKFSPVISEELYLTVMNNVEILDSSIIDDRDFLFDYFGFKTLQKSYLLKADKQIVERPQYMYMRVSLGIHGSDIKSAIETYNQMSLKYFTHATPTLFNSGTVYPQMSSCFLLTMQDDSVEGIYSTLKQCALISKSAGGIGLSINNIRSSNSYISGTNGFSNGIVPMLKVFNDTARYIDQGGGKRKGAFAIYIEPWHSDIFEFLELKKNTGKDELRCRDLFLALWVPDLFMKCVEQDTDWALFCPNEAPGLDTVFGKDFEELYSLFVNQNKYRKIVKARELFAKICESQIETGVPYILYKDACNLKSSQGALIRSSNLCTEITLHSSPDEIAVCNLASISLPSCCTTVFNFDKLFEITVLIVNNLNKIIDRNYYPVPETKRSNMNYRPLGIGIQGLADTFIKLRYPFDSLEAKKLNMQIFETMYYAALSASVDLAKKEGPYPMYNKSPMSRGLLQFDLWNKNPGNLWNWEDLKIRIKKYGLRNSTLLAPMPTASTSQILGNNESFEPYTSNIYSRRVLSGEFTILNRHLFDDLTAAGLWSTEMKNKIISNNGSVKNIKEIPDDLKLLYRTVWEIPQKSIIDMAADRGIYIDQSQSMNIYISDPDLSKMYSMHLYGWKKGLKTGMYYLRTKPSTDAVKFTVPVEQEPVEMCSMKEGCLTCGS